MLKLTRTMHIDADPDAVLRYVVDATGDSTQWTVETIHETPDYVGTTYAWSTTMFGITLKGVEVVTEYVPGQRSQSRNFGSMEGTSTWTVFPEDGGTRLTVEVEFGLAIPLIGRLLDPFLEREFDKNLAMGKKEIEEGVSEAVPA
jgi:hypothetical protein